MTAVDQGQIVVSRSPEGGGKVRTGELLGVDGTVMTVRWHDDGREENVRMTIDTTFVVPGTLRHEAYVDPAGLTARLKSDPVAVFAQLLRENPGYLSAAQIKQKLTDLRLDEKVLNEAWKKAQTKLKKHPQVKASGRKYRWFAVQPKDTQPQDEDQAEPAQPQEQEQPEAEGESPAAPATQEGPHHTGPRLSGSGTGRFRTGRRRSGDGGRRRRAQALAPGGRRCAARWERVQRRRLYPEPVGHGGPAGAARRR